MSGPEKLLSYFIWTIGCQMNKADSERIRALMDGWGLQPAENAESADAIILNSCVVRQKAENRVLSKLGSLATLKREKPDTSIIVTGCLVDGQSQELRREYPHIDAFFKPGEFDEIAAWMISKGFAACHGSSPAPLRDRSLCAFIPIIQGCDNFCSYCIVPYRRGREKSRPAAEIICEARQMAARGIREITLVGQNVDSYGHDLPERPDLAGLLRELNGVEGIYRIRFLTSHPKDMTSKLIQLIPHLPKVCEHINLPVQAGSDEILKKMGRGYRAQEYRSLIAEIRAAIPGVALSTDVIVGFPGETEEQFRETFDMLRDIKFDAVHVAAYSPRPGTVAARTMADDVPVPVKGRRLQEIENFQEKTAAAINASLVGKTVEILVEKRSGEKWMGRTRTNKLVFFERAGDFNGRLVPVKITGATAWSMKAELEPEGIYAAA